MQITRETYLEYIAGTSDKFYLLYLADHSGHYETVSIWGKRGSEGKTTILYQGNNPSAAADTWNHQEREKLRKGYQPATMPQGLRGRLNRLTGSITPAAVGGTAKPLSFTPMVAADGVSGARLKKAIETGVYASSPLVSGQRVFCVFAPADGRLSVVDARGSLQSQMLASVGRLVRNGSHALHDTIIDGTFASGTLHATDIIRYNGNDVRDYPLQMRDTILAQAFGGLEDQKELDRSWEKLDLTPLAPDAAIPANSLLRDLTSAYDDSLREAWLISD